MVTYAYKDNIWRNLTEFAYQAHIKAGKDVSGYTSLSQPATNPVVPTPTVQPPTQPTQSAPVAPTTTVLPISKESEVYKQLTAKGYDDAKILDLYNQAKAKKTPEEQARITKQEPVKPSTAIDPMAEPATPAVNVNVNNAPAKPVESPKTDQWPLTPLALSEYQDNSTVRQNEIVNNLNWFRQSNPEYLTNLDTFRKTFSYGLRSDDQKQLLDNWYLGYQKWVKLWIMWTNAIVDQYWSGNITSSDLEQLRLNNPSKYQEVMDAINKKDIVRTYQNELYETDEQKTIMAQLDEADWQWSIFEEYKNTINSDEVKALQTEIQDMETQREQLSLELNDIKDQVEKRYEWTGATKWKISYIVAKESAALQKQITSLWIDSANRVDKYNSIVNTAKETMQLQLQEQEAERAARNQKMSELGFYYEYDPVGMAERAENIFNIENPDINSPDANTARRALNNELTKYYEKYGDIIMRPQSIALDDIIAQAKTDGTSLSAALKKNFTDQLQSKQLYGQALGKNLGFDMGSYSMSQLPDGNWTVNAKAGVGSIVNINWVDYMQSADGTLSNPAIPYNGTTYVWSGMKWAWLTNNNPWNIKDQSFWSPVWVGKNNFAQFATPEDWFDALVEKIEYNQNNSKSAYYGKTIAQYFQKYAPSSDGNNPAQYAASVAKQLGVSVNTKISDVDATKFAAAIAKHDSWYDYSTYWQFRWTATNWNAPTAISDFDYSKFNNTTFKPQDIKDEATKTAYKAYLEERQRIFNDPEATAEDILKVSLWWWDLSDTSLQKLDKFTWVLSSLWEISKSVKDVKSWPINWILSSNNPYNTKAQLLKAQLTSMTPALARWVYWEVGVLTDNDIRLYQQTIPNLKQTVDVQKAVLAMTLKTVQRWMENSLKTQARAGKDVSAFIWELKSIQSQVATIERWLWIWTTTTTTPTTQFGFLNWWNNITSSRQDDIDDLVN